MLGVDGQRRRRLTMGVGTMTVYPHGDESLRAQELGASIFVSANRYMMKAAEVSCHHGLLVVGR